jgi:hypothetical protein
MKNLLWFFVFIMFSCENEEPQNQIIGSWRWVVSQGGIAGLTIKPDENNQKQMVFDKNGIFTLIENGKTTISIKYVLSLEKSITSQDKVPMIVFPDENAMNLSYSIKGDSLYLFEEVYDGFGHTYVRLK